MKLDEIKSANLDRGPIYLEAETDRVAIVTGAAGGIGRATVEAFVDRGWSVVAVDRAQQEWQHDSVTGVVADVTSMESMREAVNVARRVGTLRACVANAGVIDEGFAGFMDAPVDGWRSTLEVNVLGAMVTFRCALEEMRERGGGRLIATSSVAGLRAEADVVAYSASKAALCSVVRSLALEFGRAGVAVNAVAPGPVSTGMQDEVLARRPAEGMGGRLDDLRHALRPLGRMATPEEVGGIIVWLTSDAAAYVTGQTLAIDGGGVLL